MAGTLDPAVTKGPCRTDRDASRQAFGGVHRLNVCRSRPKVGAPGEGDSRVEWQTENIEQAARIARLDRLHDLDQLPRRVAGCL